MSDEKVGYICATVCVCAVLFSMTSCGIKADETRKEMMSKWDAKTMCVYQSSNDAARVQCARP